VRRNYQQEYLMGKKVVFPRVVARELSVSLENDYRDCEETKMRANFAKRIGRRVRDEPPPALDTTCFVKGLLRQDQGDTRYYLAFNAYFGLSLKGLDVQHFQKYEDDPPDMSIFLQKLKDIAKHNHARHKLVDRKKLVRELLALQSREERMEGPPKEYRMDEEMQLPHALHPPTLPFKQFKRPRARKGKPNPRAVLEVVKTRASSY
jgi:hypothetical protein